MSKKTIIQIYQYNGRQYIIYNQNIIYNKWSVIWLYIIYIYNDHYRNFIHKCYIWFIYLCICECKIKCLWCLYIPIGPNSFWIFCDFFGKSLSIFIITFTWCLPRYATYRSPSSSSPPSTELGRLILTTQGDDMLTEMMFASGPSVVLLGVGREVRDKKERSLKYLFTWNKGPMCSFFFF